MFVNDITRTRWTRVFGYTGFLCVVRVTRVPASFAVTTQVSRDGPFEIPYTGVGRSVDTRVSRRLVTLMTHDIYLPCTLLLILLRKSIPIRVDQ